jgi:hypothetical protein
MPTPNVKKKKKKTLGVHVLESMFCRKVHVSQLVAVFHFSTKKLGKI